MQTVKRAFLYSFRRSLPILFGFLPVGMAYGILMYSAGYGFLWSGACSLVVLGGSLQYLMVQFFTEPTPIVTVIVMSLMLNSRHIFYGLSFLDRFRRFSAWKYFLIYALSDEAYSLHCSYQPQPKTDEKWTFVFSAMFVVLYWVLTPMLGGLIGALVPFDTTGIEFAMTALFTTILLDMLKDVPMSLPAWIALCFGLLSIVIFGPDQFILPALLASVTALTLLRGRIEPVWIEKEAAP